MEVRLIGDIRGRCMMTDAFNDSAVFLMKLIKNGYEVESLRRASTAVCVKSGIHWGPLLVA